MRLTRTLSVSERRKNLQLGSLRTRKKHKRLDAICEKAYNRNHRGVKAESNDCDVGGGSVRNESELRRSTRVRRPPVVLDASPPPAKKRRIVDKRGEIRSVGREVRNNGVKSDSTRSTSRDVEETQHGSWRSRLRSRVRRKVSLPRGKTRLFGDLKKFSEEVKVQGKELDDKEEELEGGLSTVVKSKRPGRITASNVSGNAHQEIDSCFDKDHGKEKNEVAEDREKDEVEEDKENEVDVLDDNDEVDVLDDNDEKDPLRLKSGDACESEDEDEDGTTQLVEKEDSEVPRALQLEDGNGNDNVETTGPDMQMGLPESVKDGQNQRDSVQVGGVLTVQVGDGTCHKKPLQDKNATEVDRIDCASSDTLGMLRVREGRICGLCRTGTDGKLPKKLMRDGAGSDHEVYSGSSASEEPNYDKWDGFGDEPGWLGRLLGPINDRYGIAGIWVHQHCAVWSPEVYFAGLGCLKNVRAALCRGRVLKCTRCGRPGATIGCRVDRCPKTYHLPCARTNGCIFDHRKFLIACTDHRHLFLPHGSQQFYRMKKIKAKKMKLEMRKSSNEAWRKDLEAEEKWLENCGEDEEFLKRESKRLHRDLLRIAPVYIGGSNSENEIQFPGWESVAGLQDVTQCMKEVVILPLLYPEFFSNMGLTPPRGVLLHGYPGTGKTLVVRALIGSCARGDRRIAYFARKGADCLGKYVGDAERQLRLLFQVAEKSQPSIIFFDEIDGLAPCRTRQQDQTHNSVVSTLLALLDGLKSRGSVVVIGATNRPDAVDPALRRPGRFDREIYFPLPSVEDRAAILSLHTRRWPKPVTGSLLKWIARRTVGFAGADLQALCTQAAIIALRRNCSLQELFSAAEKKAPHGKHPPLPTFAVEERDWLEALSCAPPPCSRRGAGMAANGVESSPLHSYLSPCLLQPLSRLLVSLYLDERLLLPPPFHKAATLIKSVIVSALDKKKVLTDHWWSHIHELLEEADVLRNIGINLSLGGIFIGQANDSKFDAWTEDNNDDNLKFNYPKVQQIGTRTSLLQNISNTSGKKLGFRMLISGSPRSGQRYLASCLLHCFVGNFEIQKIDLATISQEGHGDVIQGVTRILMRCASVGSCLIFMPRIDLWAMETCTKVDKVDRNEKDSFLINPKSSEDLSFVKQNQGGKQDNQFREKIGELSERTVSQDACPKTSHIWNLFVEQVESICVSTSLMILATSEVPFLVLPYTIRQFFKTEILDCSLSTPSEETIPQFSVHLDGNFNHDSVISSSAVELSNDLIQQFVQLIHHRTHVHLSSCMKTKICDTLEGDANQGCHGKDSGSASTHKITQFSDSSVVKVSCPLNSRPPKGKTSLLLAISTFGYQILRYPHFAELCWATSKLKDGPCADINGAWKGWPFNSCIIRPNNSLENVTVACASSNIKSKENSGLVRGLVAVGLSAYRGIYVSLREVSSEVRKVLELLAGEINAKIHAGKDRYQFIRLLSQMAYLEDVVNSWVYTLQSLDVDAQTSCPAPKLTSLGSLDNYKRCDNNPPQNDGCELDVSIQSSQEMLEGSLQRFELNKGAGDFDPISVGRVITEGHHHQQFDLHQPTPDLQFQSSAAADVIPLAGKLLNEHNWINPEPCWSEDPGNHSCVEAVRHSNGFEYSHSVVITGDGPCPGEPGSVQPSSFEKAGNQHNSLRAETGSPYEDGKLGCSIEQSVDINFPSDNTASRSNDSGVVCFYRCCSECLFKLYDVMQKILSHEWGLQESRCTVEDVHDVVASLSVNLHSAVRKLFVAESSTISVDEKSRKDTIRELFEHQEKEACQCIGSEDRLTMPMECGGHPGSEESITGRAISYLNIEHGFDLKFICRDGVLSPVEPGKNISFHCKFETLCLRSLIEWILMTKQPSD